MADHRFVITNDHLEGNDNTDAKGAPFRPGFKNTAGWLPITLWDDDGELYYAGFAHEDALEDAWAWGAWYAGTTALRVRGELTIG